MNYIFLSDTINNTDIFAITKAQNNEESFSILKVRLRKDYI